MSELFGDLPRIVMPTLSQRKADVREIGNKILRGFCQLNPVEISDRGWRYLENLNWERGVEQLELLILNLLKQTTKSKIDQGELVNLLPRIDNDLRGCVVVDKKLTIQELAEKIVNKDHFDLENEHPAIQKAVEYISLNYHRTFDLKLLSRYSCVSPSHLSFLLRSRLNTSFKQILNLCRIEKSLTLLKENPIMQVTEISSNLGFCDLSHFEKTFRKQLGISPKEYRRLQANRSDGKPLLVQVGI